MVLAVWWVDTACSETKDNESTKTKRLQHAQDLLHELKYFWFWNVAVLTIVCVHSFCFFGLWYQWCNVLEHGSFGWFESWELRINWIVYVRLHLQRSWYGQNTQNPLMSSWPIRIRRQWKIMLMMTQDHVLMCWLCRTSLLVHEGQTSMITLTSEEPSTTLTSSKDLIRQVSYFWLQVLMICCMCLWCLTPKRPMDP